MIPPSCASSDAKVRAGPCIRLQTRSATPPFRAHRSAVYESRGSCARGNRSWRVTEVLQLAVLLLEFVRAVAGPPAPVPADDSPAGPVPGADVVATTSDQSIAAVTQLRTMTHAQGSRPRRRAHDDRQLAGPGRHRIPSPYAGFDAQRVGSRIEIRVYVTRRRLPPSIQSAVESVQPIGVADPTPGE